MSPSTPANPSHAVDRPYPEVPTRADFPAIERRILARWADQGTFERSVEQRPSDDEYVFYDGPPFANGLPHYGHLLTGYVKDVVPRYQTMRGHRVERRFGWDCHGLPAEMQTEKELEVSGRVAITDYGIDRFNDACRTSVLRFTGEWERYVTRQARWVDFDQDYKTMDASYMESVIWAFRQLWDKGLIYEAYRVMPYSWGAETPLSNFEIRLDDATRPRQDPALTVAFSVEAASGEAADLPSGLVGPDGTEIWAWTTTPWTLPSNLALAVGPSVDYAVVQLATGPRAGRRVVLGANAIEKYRNELGEGHEVVATLPGSALAGVRYRPMFAYFADHADSFAVLVDDYVTDDDGTGVVHMAPGFGEDDQRVCEANGIVLVCPVDDSGRFTTEVTDYVGQNVFDANPQIISDLKADGTVVRHDTYDHNYPHCWRTDTPIIYKAVSSWYVEVTAIRDRLVELNQQINWIPGHVRDGQFGKWLEGARDWSISRNRFWGSPIPVWRSDDPAYPRTDVYGSIDEIERDFGVRPDNLHRPYIDDLTRPNPDDPTGNSTMRRVSEVFDCWFESGAMPFAQVHYPFEHREWFDEHAPADFIVEYIAQTRGWFYTLHVLSGALFDRPAFSNVICHGVVLDHEGRKLSKKLRNYPDPEEVFESHGSDALRWHLMSSPILPRRRPSDRDRRIGLPRGRPPGAQSGLERLLVLHHVRERRWTHRPATGRRVRPVGPLPAGQDGGAGRLDDRAHGRLRHRGCLRRGAGLSGRAEQLVHPPVARAVLGAGGVRRCPAGVGQARRVRHAVRRADHADPPGGSAAADGRRGDPSGPVRHRRRRRRIGAPRGLARSDRAARATATWSPRWTVCVRSARSRSGLREDHRLRARLPLQRLTIAGPDLDGLDGLTHLIRDEVNVKEVVLTDDVASIGQFLLRPNAKVLGPRLGKTVQTVIRAAKAGEWTQLDDGTVSVAGETLGEGEFELALEPTEGRVASPLRDNDAVVELDVEVTDQLRNEGRARDVVRAVQQARKDAGLHVTDRIELSLGLGDELAGSIEAHRAWIDAQVLATTSTVVPFDGDPTAETDGLGFTVAVTRSR